MKQSRTESLLLLVGRLVYSWTNTESLLIYVMAHLTETRKEVAIVTFLTLNTTRARLDFVERLAKLPPVPPSEREPVLEISARLKEASRLRNKYSHCIYSFDEQGEIGSTQLLRIAESGETVRYGKVDPVNADEIHRIEETITGIQAINKFIIDYLMERGIAL